MRKIRQITDWDIDRFVKGVAAVVQLVPVPSELSLCRDSDDDLILETALYGKANYVVTRDEDMTRDLDLVEHLRQLDIEILTVQQFSNLLRLDENSV